MCVTALGGWVGGGDGRDASTWHGWLRSRKTVRGVCFPLQITLLQQIKSSQPSAAKDKLLPCIMPARSALPSPASITLQSPSLEYHTQQQTSMPPPSAASINALHILITL